MKVGDYIVCKSIPNDAPEFAFTVDEIYRIKGITEGYDDEFKVYFIIVNDGHPYILHSNKLYENFESLRDRNLDLLF